ncbi:MAG: DUF3810 domain-containing protein [Ruminococcaceae bacterium]|nr:DUF3810 domain-containing protein [Oscillospiraceae bacterium]
MKKQKTQEKDVYIESLSAKDYAYLTDEEKKLWRAVPKKHERIPLFCKIMFCLAGVCLIIYVSAIFSEKFADFFNFRISSFFRMILAKITGIFPFSLAEFIIISIIPATVVYIIFAIKQRSHTWKMVISALSVPFAAVALIFSLFVMTFATGYRTPTLDKKLGIEQTEITKSDLNQTTRYLINQLNTLSSEIEYGEDDLSKMPYSFEEMNKKLNTAYDAFCQKNDFITTFDSKLKPVMLSKGMSYMHTLGIYTFFTGETNINIDFPDYSTPFTAAHEMAHQRGIAREDEANMMAFLVCMESEDPYILYSAYLNMYEYVAKALRATDAKLFYEADKQLNVRVLREQIAYSEFFMQYYDSGASKVSSAVNDTFLKIQGTEGEISYDLVVRLTVAYLKNNNIIN